MLVCMDDPSEDARDPETGRWLTWKGKPLPLPRSEWPRESPGFDAFSWYLNRQHPAEVAAGWLKPLPEKPRCVCPSWSRHWMGSDSCAVPDEELYPEDWNDGRYLPVTLDARGAVVNPREVAARENRR